MSKSVKRVMVEAEKSNLGIQIIQTEAPTKTAQQAANFVGCHIDQIGKSILITGAYTEKLHLFLTPGGRHVDLSLAAKCIAEPTTKADARQVRTVTGFTIGGVSPIGHITKIPVWFCPEVFHFETIWVAAGTPNHLFEIAPSRLKDATSARQASFLQEI
ncbi:MAG: YbaK/EbsC family protein [Pseudomonadota bacterium]